MCRGLYGGFRALTLSSGAKSCCLKAFNFYPVEDAVEVLTISLLLQTFSKNFFTRNFVFLTRQAVSLPPLLWRLVFGYT